jgi:hypothetical protein
MWRWFDVEDPGACRRCGRDGVIPAGDGRDEYSGTEEEWVRKCPDCQGRGIAVCQECRRQEAVVIDVEDGRYWCTPCWLAESEQIKRWRAEWAMAPRIVSDDDLPF